MELGARAQRRRRVHAGRPATGHAGEIEEERRLLYVAMTRAKHQLTLLVPQKFHVTQQAGDGDRHLYGQLTRFIPEALAQRHLSGVAPAAVAPKPPTPWHCRGSI